MTDLISQYIELKKLDKLVIKYKTGLLSLRDIMDSNMRLMTTEQWQNSVPRASNLVSMPDRDSDVEWNIVSGRRTGKTTYLMSRVYKIMTEERDTHILWLCRTRDRASMYSAMFNQFCGQDTDIRRVLAISSNRSRNNHLNFLSTSIPNGEGFSPNTFNNIDPSKLVVVIDDSFEISYTEIVSKLRILVDEYQQFRILTAGTGDFNLRNIATTIINCDNVYTARVHLEYQPF